MENHHRIGLYLRQCEEQPLNIVNEDEVKVIKEDNCNLSENKCTLDEFIRQRQRQR